MKKVNLLLSVIVICFVIFVSGCTSQSDIDSGDSNLDTQSPQSGNNEQENIEPENNEPEEVSYTIGNNIDVDDLRYKIVKVESFTEMGSSMMSKETTGKFVKVYLEITNMGKETQTLFTPRFKVVDNQDRKYDRLSDDMMYISDYISFGEQLQPGLKKEGAIVFELPMDSTDLSLEIRGNWVSASEIDVSLSTISDIGQDTTLEDKVQGQIDEMMSKCNSPFTCSSSCSEYMDTGQKDCPSGQLCCME
jgi:hypothetical protein